MEEWKEVAKIAIDVLVACIIMSALLLVLYLSRQIMGVMEQERRVTADVQDYRVARMYEDSDCNAQDIISLILEHQGSPEVIVTTKSGTTMRWGRDSMHTNLSAAEISSVLNQSSIYVCTLTYDANGSLTEYKFKEV